MPAKPKQTQTLIFQDAISGQKKIYENMAELAPDIWMGDIPPEDVPPVGFVSWHALRDGSGTYMPIVRTFQARLRLTREIGKLLGVGLPDTESSRVAYDTIRRLIMAGFIKASQLGPGGVEIDLQSFWAHYQATRKPGFWTPERRRQYRRKTRGTIIPDADD